MTQLHDIRPVLLRAREIPSAAEIDEKWVSRFMHVLILALPSQLAVDAQEVVDEIEPLARSLVRRRAEMNQIKADLDAFVEQGVPTDPDKLAHWREELRSWETRLSDADRARSFESRKRESLSDGFAGRNIHHDHRKDERG